MLNLLNWIQDQHDVIPVKLNSLSAAGTWRMEKRDALSISSFAGRNRKIWIA
jgi:hypothetical protein